MDRNHFYALMNGTGDRDYEKYLNTKSLLSCQKDFADLCNRDELQFMVVHQCEELWMKLIAYTLLEADEAMQSLQTNRALTLFTRVHKLQLMMIDQLALLETMSPKDYHAIRLELGQGSGQESPGFRVLLQMFKPLWHTFQSCYLDSKSLTLEQIYSTDYKHCDSYMIAESLAEFDELFQKFRFHHVMLIHRSIGMGAKSLKGRSVDLLIQGTQHKFFPELWEMRNQMTDGWGAEYGVVRDTLS